MIRSSILEMNDRMQPLVLQACFTLVVATCGAWTAYLFRSGRRGRDRMV